MDKKEEILKGKNIVVGVSGGIACYKSASIVGALKKKGAEVYVIMTKNAREFITPLTLKTLSENDVVCDMFEERESAEVKHITLAEKADAFIIAPASANIIGKVAHGIADDMLSTTIMATKSPVIFAPAMNCNMYSNAIVQDNIKKLKSFGYKFISPQNGHLACGTEGVGKLADTRKIIEEIEEELSL